MHKEMKDSRIDWVKHIPAHWKIHPIYSYFNERKNKNSLGKENNLLSLSYGRIIRKNINTTEGLLPKSFNTYHIVEAGDIIIRPTDLQNDKRSLRTGLVKEHGIITSAYIDLAPKKALDPRYFHYLLHSYDISKVFYNMGNGVRQSLSFPEFSHLMMIEPPLEEQKQIANFLDHKCDEIDALHADIEKQIATLEDYKKSIITEAVTKGLNPDIEMKDCVSTYWSTIPNHWNLSDIKYLFEIVKRIAGKEGFDILSVTQRGLKIKDISNNEGQIAESYANYQFVYPNDFVMNHMDLLTGWVDCSQYFGVTSPDYRVFRLRNQTNNLSYYKYVMQVCYMNKIFYSLGQGVSTLGRWRLQTSSFNNFQIPVPPTSEQQEIADYLDQKTTEIDAIISAKKQQLDILDNYKKSLIYEYVTGKKEVPSYANAE